MGGQFVMDWVASCPLLIGNIQWQAHVFAYVYWLAGKGNGLFQVFN